MNNTSKILIVDDDPMSITILGSVLKKEGHTVISARDGLQALQKIEDDIPDIVLTDIMMPEMNGFELCSKLRSNPLYAEIPIIMITGLQDKDSKIKGLEMGADDFISKPFDQAELKVRVSSILKLNRFKNLVNEREKFERIVNLLPDGIMILDDRGIIVQVNTALIEMLGFNTNEYLINKNIISFVSKDDLFHFYLKQILSKELNISHVESNFARSNFDIFPVGTSLGQFTWEGKPAVIVLVRDITETKANEEKILEQAALLDKTQDAIIVIDMNDNIIFWNKGAEKIYNLTSINTVGKNFNAILNNDQNPEFIEAKFHVREKGEWSSVFKKPISNNKVMIIESRWSLIYSNDGNEKSILIIDRDITEKIKLEEQFLRAQRMENIGVLASGIAHDLNNIFSPILLISQLLESKLEDEKLKSFLSTLVTNAQRGGNLVKQILSFARGFGLERTSIQIRHILKDIQKISEETFNKSISIKTELPKDLWVVLANPTQLDQVFLNLCVNARDAMPNGGTITIKAENFVLESDNPAISENAKAGDYVLIKIIDTGTGISEENIKKIFDPFFTTKEIGKGTGLGLSTVISIINEHNGFITVESEIGKGTAFCVYFPASKEIYERQKSESDNSDLLGNKETILFVDDETSMLKISKTILEGYDYRVLTAMNGAEAVRIFVEHKDEIKAVILDMIMPVMDGPLCAKALKQISPDVKIIASTGFADIETYVNAIGQDVYSFLSKPYTTEAMLKMLNEILKNN